ncbi:vacuolar protein-sorting protein VPS46 [Acrasis kona]|uniref:Vacuolar protein-sorting protein VPS46 n=1 Tax=Acrasis kona TaxID=1008807 RepID=A0AAW2ZKA6_9EUKA
METINDLQLTSNSYRIQSLKSQREAEESKLMVKKCMEKGDLDRARIYAEKAVRKRNESNNYLKLSNKLEATTSNVQQLTNAQQLQQKMNGIVGDLGHVMKTINIDEISNTMNSFEDFDSNLGVSTDYMEKSMSSIDYSIPDDEVGDLVAQIADDNNLQLSDQLQFSATSRTDPMDQLQKEYFAKKQDQYVKAKNKIAL